MTRSDDDIRLFLVDGDNLLHRLRGGRDRAGLAWLIPRLRASLPPGAHAILVLDGYPDPGRPARQQAAPGVEFRHSMRTDADTTILEILAARPFEERGRVAVITDDRALTERARHAGGLTRRLDWLRLRLERPGAVLSSAGTRRTTGLGQGRPPTAAARVEDEERTAWRPGRGATRKAGNPKRSPRRGDPRRGNPMPGSDRKRGDPPRGSRGRHDDGYRPP